MYPVRPFPKWKSDAAIPEIDKLIALGKLFGVSIGWLLGVEELVKRYQTPPKPHLTAFHSLFATAASLLIFCLCTARPPGSKSSF